jgi:hypothetical protein
MPVSIRPHRRLPLTYVLGFTSLITFLMLSSGPAYAEWVKLSGDGRVTSYTDAKTIRRSGNLVRMWDLLNFETLQGSRDPYFSIKAVREYDCTLEQSRIIGRYAYSGQMGAGEMVDSQLEEEVKWEPVMPGSWGQDLWEIACGKP